MSEAYTKGKTHLPNGIGYDQLSVLDFDAITLGANQVSTTVFVPQALPVNIKIFSLTALLTGTVAGSASVNVCLGTAAENGLGPPDNSLAGVTPPATAAAGNCLFATDQALTMTANTPQIFYPINDGWDIIWPKNGLLGLRVPTGAATTGTLKVTLAVVVYDLKPWRPQPSDSSFAPGANTL